MKSKFPITWVLISFALLSVKISNAQSTGFKLSDYKNPEYIYQTLDLNFGLKSDLGGNEYSGFENHSGNSFSLNSQAGAVYKRYLNSQKAQGDLYFSFDGSIGSAKDKSNYEAGTYSSENELKSSNHTERLNIAGLHRFYNLKQNFIELNGALGVSNSVNSSNDKSYLSGMATGSQESQIKNFENSVKGSFLIGKGRIEQVQDARMAIYILDDLYKLNREKRSVSDEDVMSLAQLITTLKYKRFFDDRLRKIAEIMAIDSFMQQKGIVSATDATYFTLLNDNWQYANNPIRANGHRLFTGLEAYFDYSYHNEYLEDKIPDDLIRETTNKDKTSELYMVLGYAYEKPASLKWQYFANVKGSVGIRQHFSNKLIRNDQDPVTETDLYLETAPAINFTGNCGLGYYPDSRTWLELIWRLNSSWENKMEGSTKADKADLQNNFNINTGPQLYAYYYLSEKLRLRFAYSGYLNYDNYKYTSDVPEGSIDKATRAFWTQSINVALTYSLF